MLTLLDFKRPGLEDILRDLQDMEKYKSAYIILMKVNDYADDDLYGEIGSVSVLVEMLAEFLRSDVHFASVGTMSYFYHLKIQIKAQPLSVLTLYELTLFQEMIENIEKITFSKAR